MIPGYTEWYVIVIVSVYLSLDQYGNEYSVASTCLLDCHFRIHHDHSSSVEVSQSSSAVGFPPFFFGLSPNSSTKNGGRFTGLHTPMLPCWVSQPSSIKKSTVFIPGKELPFQPTKKNCANFIGSFSAQKMEWIYQTTRFFECVKRKEFVLNGWNCPIFWGKGRHVALHRQKVHIFDLKTMKAISLGMEEKSGMKMAM